MAGRCRSPAPRPGGTCSGAGRPWPPSPPPPPPPPAGYGFAGRQRPGARSRAPRGDRAPGGAGPAAPGGHPPLAPGRRAARPAGPGPLPGAPHLPPPAGAQPGPRAGRGGPGPGRRGAPGRLRGGHRRPGRDGRAGPGAGRAAQQGGPAARPSPSYAPGRSASPSGTGPSTWPSAPAGCTSGETRKGRCARCGAPSSRRPMRAEGCRGRAVPDRGRAPGRHPRGMALAPPGAIPLRPPGLAGPGRAQRLLPRRLRPARGGVARRKGEATPSQRRSWCRMDYDRERGSVAPQKCIALAPAKENRQ